MVKYDLLYFNSHGKFVQKELRILRQRYKVKSMFINPKSIRSVLRMFYFLAQSKAVFSWFADLASAEAAIFSKILRKKIIIHEGGYGAAYVPEIDYGLKCHPIKKYFPKISFSLANMILVMAESLKRDIIKNYSIKPEKIKYILLGYDEKKWRPKGKKEDIVLTISGGINWQTMKRKGLETFVRAAEFFPDKEFVIIGRPIDDSEKHLKKIASKNVKLTGFISDEDLLRYYQRSKVFCQISLYEGLPSALCEAMLCECVPVGTKNCGIPTAIGDTGFYAEYGNVKDTVKAIEKALANEQRGKIARERIIELFNYKERNNDMYNAIDEIIRS